MFQNVRELICYKSMIQSFIKKEVRGRYKGSILGFLWNFITPLMQIIVYIMVFTIVFRPNIDNYAIYLIVGMVPWIFFSESISSGSGAIINNSELVKKIYFPRTVLPISIVLSKFVNYMISTCISFGIIILLGFDLNWQSLLLLPLAILLILVFSLGLTFLLSAIDTYLRDIEYIVNVILMVLIWMTPIMYVREQFDSAFFNFILSINPVTYFIELFQDIIYFGTIPDISLILICTALAAVMLIIGWVVFHKLEPDFAEAI